MLKKRNPIEQILIDHGKITEKTLEEVRRNDFHRGKYLGKVLVDHGYIHSQVLLETLSHELGFPYLQAAEFPKETMPISGLEISEVFLKEKLVLPLKMDTEKLMLAAFDPFDLETFENLKVSLGKEIEVHLSSQEDILEGIERFYGKGHSTMGRMVSNIQEEDTVEVDLESTEHIRDIASEAPVIKLVNHIINQAIEINASDIHLEPFADDLILRYRIDGMLYEHEAPPKRLNSAIVTRIKIMAHLDIAERRLPQDGRIRIQAQGKDIDIRVSTLPTLFGESVVMRILDRGNIIVNLDHLGFPEKELKLFQELIHKPYGQILVTGPTGSGKTTTLYGSLEKINTPEKKIVTIEDPVEYQLRGVNQVHIRPQIGLSFANGLRSIVRQDPDVIMIGEIRDSETADVAIQSALTGHLVFSTVHTNDAAGAITRLQEMEIESFLISSALLGVLAQRLVRVICKECKESCTMEESALSEMGLGKLQSPNAYRGKGCSHCNQTGYRGRTGIYELLVINDEIRPLILSNASSQEIRERAVQCGMKTLRQDGWRKVLEGVTTVEEIIRVTHS
ncbi:MAG: type II secretion system ATPase GspE [Nitrospinota bacterium]|nr:type II secretion system ATPase GspE [Nitrospinota bacterium]